MSKYKMRLIIEILLVIAIIVLLGIIFINVVSFENNSGKDEKKTEEMIEQLNELLINGGTKEEIIALTGIDDIDEEFLFTGKDSYMSTKPSEKDISTYKLDNYVKEQEKYTAKVEEKIKNNFRASLDSITKEDDHKVYSVHLTSYYQIAYLLDLKELQDQLLSNSGQEPNKINMYKAKVIALKILNDKLDDYENKDERCMANLYVYKDDPVKTKESIITYINLLQGLNYHNEGIFIENQQNIKERISTYIKEAIANKIIKESLLEL